MLKKQKLSLVKYHFLRFNSLYVITAILTVIKNFNKVQTDNKLRYRKCGLIIFLQLKS